jgi:dipeptide/tripeptide permease
MMPTMTAAVRRYTNRETVAFGFSFFYVVMNIGALVAPLTVGALRKWLKGGLDLGGLHLTTSQVIFTIATVVTALAAWIVMRLRDDTPAASTDGKPKKGPGAIFAEVSKERAFWGFMLFVSLLVLVRLIFQHAHQTWPKYTMRVIDKDFDWAFFWSINPAMVIVLTPVMTALTRGLSAFWCIVTGAFITAGSVFFLVASDTVAAQVAFVATLSVGECLWSPRLYEYTATIAPPGREASYMGLSQVPMFFAKMAVGGISGYLLTQYCPETGERQPHLMWAIIGADDARRPHRHPRPAPGHRGAPRGHRRAGRRPRDGGAGTADVLALLLRLGLIDEADGAGRPRQGARPARPCAERGHRRPRGPRHDVPGQRPRGARVVAPAPGLDGQGDRHRGSHHAGHRP